MKKYKARIFLICSVFCLTISACQAPSADLTKAPEFVSYDYADFTQSYPDKGFMISDGWSNSMTIKDPFGCTWNKSQVSGNEDDGLILTVEKTDDLSLIKNAAGEQAPNFDPYLGGELKTTHSFKYGFFGAYMKPSNVSGTVSTFFTYTGPTENNPHDEIDIEFLGKNTKKVQFNYYSGSDKSHEAWHTLGFDASEEYHHYGFYWGENEITWYVDFKPVYRVANIKAPSHECKLFTSHWKVNSKDFGISFWGGKIDESKLPSKSYIREITVANKNGEEVKPLPKGIDYDYCPKDGQLETVKGIMLTHSTEYTVVSNETDNSFDVTYTDLAPRSWKNISFKTDSEKFAESRWLAVSLENKGAQTSKIRLTVNDSNGGSSFLQIKKAWANRSESNTSLSGDGTIAYVNVPANEKVDFIVHFYGLDAQSFYFMIDSADSFDGTTNPKSGNVIISNFRIGGKQDYDNSSDADIPPEIFEDDDGGEGQGDDPSLDPLKAYSQKEVDLVYDCGAGFTYTKNEDGTTLIEYQNATAYDPVQVTNYSAIKGTIEGKIVGWKVEIQNLNERATNICMFSKDNSGKNLDSSKSFATGNATFDRSGGTGEYYVLSSKGTGTIQIGFNGDAVTKLRLLIDNVDTNVKDGSVKILKSIFYVDESSGEGDEGGDDVVVGLKDTFYKFPDLSSDGVTYTFTETNGGTLCTFSTDASKYVPVTASNSFELANPTYALLEVKNTSDFDIKFSVYYRISSNADGANNGSIEESELGTSSFERYSGSNGAYFIIGAGDTASLKVNMLGVPQKVRLIFNPGGEAINNGTLLLKSWKTYDAGN